MLFVQVIEKFFANVPVLEGHDLGVQLILIQLHD